MSELFNSNKFEEVKGFTDGSDAYANRGMVLGFHHIPSGKEIYFKAAITAFNEAYSSDWTSEIVYGRADAIMLFKNTERRISLAFNVASSTKSEAYENLSKVGDLAKFLYPYYTDISSATTIGQSPLVRLKVLNLLSSQKDAGSGVDFGGLASLSNADASSGLLGAIMSLNVTHNLENGEAGSIEAANGVVLPKLIEINLDFNVIHEHAIGWNNTGFGIDNASGQSFPYGLAASTSTSGQAVASVQNPDSLTVNEGASAIDSAEASDTDVDPDLENQQETESINANAQAAGTGVLSPSNGQ